MLITELIEELEKIKQRHGCIEVKIPWDIFYDREGETDITVVEVNHEKGIDPEGKPYKKTWVVVS